MKCPMCESNDMGVLEYRWYGPAQFQCRDCKCVVSTDARGLILSVAGVGPDPEDSQLNQHKLEVEDGGENRNL